MAVRSGRGAARSEPHVALLARIAAWLDSVPGDGQTVAITHAAVVRAAVLAVLQAAPAGFWRIDIAPLTATELRGRPGRWTVRSTAIRLATIPQPCWRDACRRKILRPSSE